MGSLTWLNRADLATLACPYCGRMADPASPEVLAAEQTWGFVGASLTLRGGRTAALLVTPDPETRTAMLTCLWVAPGWAGQGRGKRLIQATAAGLLSRDVIAIVARGSKAMPRCSAPPADFLRAVGFSRTSDERGGTRLWRLDLTTTAMADGLRGWLAHWVRVLRPVRPEPAGRTASKH